MKTITMLCALAVLLTTACNSDSTKEFIPGTYVNSATGEYSTADDTLAIEHVLDNNFTVCRKTGFNRIDEGKKGKREHETEQWHTVYDSGTKTLNDARHGRSVTFYPESGSLRVGTREYHKIN